jgi:S-adenosylmethionine hydrolase
MKLIALITDFGTADGFTGVVKAAIKTIDPDVDFIDVCHEVKPFSVVNAQFFLYSSYRYFPAGTVFYVVVDPGVGTERKILVAEDDKYRYVVPDNGIISAVRSGEVQGRVLHLPREGHIRPACRRALQGYPAGRTGPDGGRRGV